MPTTTRWNGDKSNGIEYRWQGDDLDEVLLWVNGECVFHAERMSDEYFWMGIYIGDISAAIYAGSTNNRSHVEMWADEWGKGGTPSAD